MPKLLLVLEAPIKIFKERNVYQVYRVWANGVLARYGYGKTRKEAIEVAKKLFSESKRGKAVSCKYVGD
jgi:hypothetical protein